MGGSGFSLGPMAGKLLADQIDQDFTSNDTPKVYRGAPNMSQRAKNLFLG